MTYCIASGKRVEFQFISAQSGDLPVDGDLGEQLYDPSIMRTAPALARRFSISVTDDGRVVNYLDDEGHAHDPKIRFFGLPLLSGSANDKVDLHIESCAIDMSVWDRPNPTPPDYKVMAENILFDFIHEVKWKQTGTSSGRIVTIPSDFDISLAFNGSSGEPVIDYNSTNSFTLDILCDDVTMEIVRERLVDAYTTR